MTKSSEWNLAGLVDDQGGLEWPLSGAGWAIPAHVEVKGEHLRWRWFGDDEETAINTYAQPGPGMLMDFTRIAEDVDKVESYARKWGTLRICRHGKPAPHIEPPSIQRAGKTPKIPWCEPRQNRDGDYLEPLSAWVNYSNQVSAMINIAAAIHRGRHGEAKDWKVLNHGGNPRWRRKQSPAEDARHLSAMLQYWLNISRARPLVAWSGKDVDVGLGSETLFGNLAIQLMLLISKSEGIVFCDGCSKPYTPTLRRPKTGQRSFCQECRARRVPKRMADRDYRARKREGR